MRLRWVARIPHFPMQARLNRMGRLPLAYISIFVLTALNPTGPAHAQSAQAQAQSSSSEGHALPLDEGFHLKNKPGWSLGLEAYAGIGVLASSDATRGHGIAGGLSRLRFGYFELGAGLEVSDLAVERWQQVGGFAGAFLPVTNWVDIDATVGLGERNYLSPDARYGPGGLDTRLPAMTLRLGFSDRPVDELFGFRVGAALLVGIDLTHRDIEWQYNPDGKNIVTGTTPVGGVSVGMAVCLGFDVAFRRPAAPRRQTEQVVEFGEVSPNKASPNASRAVE